MPEIPALRLLPLFLAEVAGALTASASGQVSFAFVDSGQSLGDDYSAGVALGDLDGDGDRDAWVANDDEPNAVWTNIAQGACCIEGRCVQLQADFCENIGDTYLGGECLDAACPDPEATGACCVGSGCDQITRAVCDRLGGTWLEEGSCDDCPITCEVDINGDGMVNAADLGLLLGAWGACP
ncbi:hypothetical protein OAG01_00725 [bacterium]|nr:hypothetical protein [bacterium]